MGIGRRLLLEPGHLSEGSRQPRGPYTSDASFDTNMVIILAALLCALVFALGLNSIVRCALRFGRRAEAGGGGNGSQATGLKKKALRAIPVTEYSGANMPATECPICLGEFAEGEKVRVLPKCNHGFHVRCIDTWLGSHSSCPTCRSSLLALAAGSSRPAGNRPEPPAPVVATPGPPPS
ncbi:RING-H2 finger protein ATL74-like [Nymphaea colorata]|nr:RING-H2 finger protein ATL74-like [Nymphaea colorata]